MHKNFLIKDRQNIVEGKAETEIRRTTSTHETSTVLPNIQYRIKLTRYLDYFRLWQDRWINVKDLRVPKSLRTLTTILVLTPYDAP